MFAESNKIISDTCRRSLPALLGQGEVMYSAEADLRAIVKLEENLWRIFDYRENFYYVDCYAPHRKQLF